MTDAVDLLRTLPALVACGFLPGWWIAGALGLEGAWARTGAAVLLSALVLFAIGIITWRGGPARFDPAPLVWALALVPAVVAWARERGRARAGEDGAAIPRRGGGPGASVYALGAWVVLVLAVYAVNPELGYRIDGWFHGAVTARLLTAGLPLEDPYFAGQPLGYPWAWHVVLAMTTRVGSPFDTSVFEAMAGWSALAALAVGALLVGLARAWARAAGFDARGEDRAGAFAVAAAVLGTNPFGAVFALGRGLVGDDAGAAALSRPFERGATEVLQAMSWNYPHVSLVTFVDKFLTPTAFGLGTAAFLAAGAVLLVPRAGGVPGDRARTVLLGVLAAVAAWLLHGAAAIGLGLVALAAGFVLARAGAARGRAVLLAVSLVASALLVAPYLAVTRGGGGGGARLGPHGDLLWSIVAVGVLVIGLAVAERARLPKAPDGRHAWFAGGLLLLAVAAVVTAVQRNETKLVQLGLVALSVPAGVAWARLPSPAAWALLLLLVPTHAMAVTGFALDRGQETPGRRVPPPALAGAYAWIGAHTSPRDLFLEAQPKGVRDPDRDLLVHGPRSLVWGGLSYASNWGYDPADLDRRARAAYELDQGTLGPSTTRDLVARAARAGGHVYAVRRGAAALAAGSHAPGGATWSRVYQGDGIALDRLEGIAP